MTDTSPARPSLLEQLTEARSQADYWSAEVERLEDEARGEDEPRIDQRPAAKAHRAATGHLMAIVSASNSSCGMCDWPVDRLEREAQQ